MSTNAKIKYAVGKVLQGEYGPRINVVVITDDGREGKVWENEGHWIQDLKKDQRVMVFQDDRQNWKIVKPENGPAETNGEPRKKTYLDPPAKKKKQNPETMKKYIDGHMELLTYAIEKSRETWKDDLNAGSDVIFRTAVTVYISMREYFNI